MSPHYEFSERLSERYNVHPLPNTRPSKNCNPIPNILQSSCRSTILVASPQAHESDLATPASYYHST